MNTSNETKNIFEAYTKCAPELKNVTKDGKAQTKKFSYGYTTLEKLIEQTKPILANYNLAIIQFPTGNGIITRLVHSSGEWIEQDLKSELIELIGQNQYQVQGSQITYLRRYAWASICGIASDDDLDAQGEQKTGQDRTKQAQKPAETQRPMNVSPSQVKLIQTRISQLGIDPDTVSMLKSHYNIESWNDLPAQAIKGLIDWFNNRERGV